VHPIEPWFFGLLEGNAGDKRALRGFMAKLDRGEAVDIVAFGGSITSGGMSASNACVASRSTLFQSILSCYASRVRARARCVCVCVCVCV
jgi:hypothetical protein